MLIRIQRQGHTVTDPQHLASKAELETFINEHDQALVEFYTAGCGICKQMEPVLGIVSNQSTVAVGMINPRDDPQLIEEYTIQSVPTLVVFADGTPVAQRAEGFIGADEILTWMNKSIDTKLQSIK